MIELKLSIGDFVKMFNQSPWEMLEFDKVYSILGLNFRCYEYGFSPTDGETILKFIRC